jgi:hypothetical protein
MLFSSISQAPSSVSNCVSLRMGSRRLPASIDAAEQRNPHVAYNAAALFL